MTHRYRRIEPCASTATGGTIGEGAYGVVYRGMDLETSTEVAMKKVRFEGEDVGVPATALREIIVLKDLEHRNVVNLMDVIIEPQRLYLVFELIDMDLKNLMDSRNEPLELSHIQSFTGQILDGLAYCHSMGIMHRDLKPQNLLVSKTLKTIKIADFGLARTFTPAGRPLTMEVITRWYRAPEILMGCQNYRCGVDVWSVGCIVAEMANSQAFLQGDSEIDQLHKIFKAFGTPNDQLWPGVSQLPFWRNTFPQWTPMAWSRLIPSIGEKGWDLMDGLMKYFPSQRLSAAAALQHSFVAPALQALDVTDTTPQQGGGITEAVMTNLTKRGNRSSSKNGNEETSTISNAVNIFAQNLALEKEVNNNSSNSSNNNSSRNNNKNSHSGISSSSSSSSSSSLSASSSSSNNDKKKIDKTEEDGDGQVVVRRESARIRATGITTTTSTKSKRKATDANDGKLITDKRSR